MGVVGSSAAGLLAASLLHEAGARVVLFEPSATPCEELLAFAVLPALCTVDRRALVGLGTVSDAVLTSCIDGQFPSAGLRVEALHAAMRQVHRGLRRVASATLQVCLRPRTVRIHREEGPPQDFDAVVLALPEACFRRVLAPEYPEPDPGEPSASRSGLRRIVRTRVRWRKSGDAWIDRHLAVTGDDAAVLDSLTRADGEAFVRQVASREFAVRADHVEVTDQHSYVRQAWPADLGWRRPTAARLRPVWRRADPRVVPCGLLTTDLDGPEGLLAAGRQAASEVLALLG